MSVTFSGKARNIAVLSGFIILCAGYGCNDNVRKTSNSAASDTTAPRSLESADSAGMQTMPDTAMPERKPTDTTRGIGVVNPRPNVNR